MPDIFSQIDSAPPLLVALTALGLLTGAFRLVDPDAHGSSRGVGGPAMIAAGLLFLYAGIAAGGGSAHLEQAAKNFVTGFFV